MNLAANARDAMPRGGRITIEVAHQRLEQPLVQGDVTVPPGECAVLSVRDTGCGMDRETLAHMFEPFFSNKEFSKGTGLGLAIVYGIVQQSGAHIVAESTPEGGSSLVIHFPITQEVPVVPEDRVVRGTSQARAETLLLVEDEAAVRALALELLETEGYTVLEAANGNEALAIAERHSGPIHLCITDVVMPGMGGGELVTHLLAQRPDTRVLYFSGYTDDAIVRHGVSRVGAAFLQKPFTYEVFVATVRELLDGPPGTGGGRSGERDAA